MGVLVVGILTIVTLVESRRNLNLKRNFDQLKTDYRNLERLHIESTKEIERVRELLAQLKTGEGQVNLPVISQIEPFDLKAQSDEKFTLKDLMGKIWLANIIFTRCPGPCPMMTRASGTNF